LYINNFLALDFGIVKKDKKHNNEVNNKYEKNLTTKVKHVRFQYDNSFFGIYTFV